MKVFIKNKGHCTLAKSEYLASGGEGDIYCKGNSIFKIYIDPNKMIPEGKINELSVLSFNNIIKPEDILLNDKNIQIGYTMQYVKDTYALCQLFPKSFRDRNSVSNQTVLNLVRRLQETIQHIHSHKILVVDVNELNFLIAKDFTEIYAIDVDSWQTPHFKATAIMDNIRDRQVKNNNFTENSDWFSFGILAFNMFVGIHPYKGTSKLYKTMDERMDHNISVLNKDVSVPKIFANFDIIPEVYKNWFSAVFDGGKRLPGRRRLQNR